MKENLVKVKTEKKDEVKELLKDRLDKVEKESIKLSKRNFLYFISEKYSDLI